MSASVLVHHAEIQLLERDDDDDDKKIELTVLMSTRPVAPHISGYISSVSIYLIHIELQLVLISTVSTFFLSSLSSRS